MSHSGRKDVFTCLVPILVCQYDARTQMTDFPSPCGSGRGRLEADLSPLAYKHTYEFSSKQHGLMKDVHQIEYEASPSRPYLFRMSVVARICMERQFNDI
jgi:hypothetical protein